MPGPCPYALAMSRVPRQKWATRAELLERVELTRKLILDAPGQDLTVAGLSRVAGISESHFIRLFRDTYGISPIKMLASRRLEWSKSLLDSGMEIAAVVLAVGYESVPTFCRRFKAAFGVTPTEYKKRNFG
ncbi:MAG: helix-turn-helix domain-containing protein [Armatimonadetes bacterium]|nr:helix-turn-helix domain-containing protein [Armatimonadota bacterium]MBS1728586.1 helix-turn-helix transcriptional regulator [Armatimonadota bacterium]